MDIHANQHVALARLAKRLGFRRISDYLMEVAICQLCAQVCQIADPDFVRRFEDSVRPYWTPEDEPWVLRTFVTFLAAIPTLICLNRSRKVRYE